MKNDQFDITIRINEAGIHVCHEDRVRNDFGPNELWYNEPFESVRLDLSDRERKMIYAFRSRHPERPSDPEVYA